MLLFISVLISYFFFDDSTLKFKPKKGEERVYQVYSTMEFNAEKGVPSEIKTSSNQLVRYKVLDTGLNTRFEMFVDYIDMKDGSKRISNVTSSSTVNPEMHAIFSQGFEFTLNKNDGKIVDFSAKNKPVWQAFLKERGGELEHNLKKLFTSPGIYDEIPAKEGAVVELPTYQHYSKIKLEVLQVTDEYILIQVEGEQNKLFGRLMLERDSGWLMQMALIVEENFERFGQKGKIRNNIFIVPQMRMMGSLEHTFSWKYDFSPYKYQNQSEPKLSDINKTLANLTSDTVFGNAEGYYELVYDTLFINYQHEFSDVIVPGRFNLTDVTAYSADGKKTPVQLNKLGHYSIVEKDGFHRSLEEFSLTGWSEPAKQLDSIVEFRAKAHYRSAKQVKLELNPDPTKTVSLQYNDLQLELIPIKDTPRRYMLKTLTEGDSFITWQFDGAEGAMINHQHPSISGPEWLTFNELIMLSLASSARYDYTILFDFPAEPQTLSVYVNTVEDSKTFTKDIRFIPVADYESKAEYPPIHEELLYQDDLSSLYPDIYDYDKQSQPVIPSDPALIEPLIIAKYGVEIQLTAEQAAMCALTVTDAPQVNGHTLRWTSINEKNDDNNDLNRYVKYRLTSEDGIRRNFYDIRVNSVLSCSGTPTWQALEYKPSKGWLIDVTQLRNLDTNQTVAEFMRRYRFLNSRNFPLAPYIQFDATDYYQHRDIKNFYQRPLHQVLEQDRWFKLAGRTEHIDELTVTGKPIDKAIVTVFPALP
ncbi:hypothetical protein H9J30_20370 [Shewanella sp. PS-2]|uniref:Uncharacterized protein n=1 Tax=Shewanella cutis TaxID=2766780 RepID=A0ABS9R0U9_9GAMM|nr:hypothetical protein [Shewanella sp. PS-2]